MTAKYVLMYSSIGVIMFFFMSIIPGGSGLECYQCNSTHSDECLERFDKEMTSLAPAPCTVVNAKYCIKITGAWGGVVGTQRFCSSRDLGNQCQYFGFDDHDRIYRGCAWTCYSDQCNGSWRISYSTVLITMPLVLITFLLS